MRYFVFAVALAACQGQGVTTDDAGHVVQDLNRSGTRLKALCTTSDDGARVCTGFFDSQFAAPCSFVQLADGQLHCLPIPAASARAAQTPSGFYGDSACTMPLVAGTFDCANVGTPPKIVLVHPPLSCPPGTPSLASAGARYTGPVFTWGTTCNTASAGLASSTPWYEVGAPVQLDDYVAGHSGPVD